MVGSAWSQTSLQAEDGETYRYMQPSPATHGNQAYQYLCGSIKDYADASVDMDANIRYYDVGLGTITSFITPFNFPMHLH